jgi:RNA polymerase-binding transcription factor DksA
MHQADAGSDAYDRDFALSLLSQEQDALYEIDEALKRIELGTYGKCEMSGKPISQPGWRRSLRPLHRRMPVAARETEQGFARPAIGHVALWPDDDESGARARKKKPRGRHKE